MKKIFDQLRRLKDWVEGYADKPHAQWALFAIAFTESSFFPIPPDVLLIAMSVIVPTMAFRYALICTAGSVLGGVFGYFIGWAFFETIGQPILQFYGAMGHYESVQQLYSEHAFWAILAAGITPIPYKVFTIAAGAFEISLATLIGASIIGRSLRFFFVAALFYFFGAPIKRFIDKYFEILTVVFLILLVGGFVVIRFVF
ncbi:MAG TPA: YqaA family protein [Pyrinomonadaceae bacterium]|nr:YqaA family protein [Pyrinomonadaceae bacterium]